MLYRDFMPQRILICQLRQIGDVVLATPAMHLLKTRWPQAEIHFLTEKKCAPVLEHNPNIHKVWSIDKQELSFFPKEIAYYWKVARQGFDLVVDFQQLPRCRWVVGFSNAKVRLSYTPPWYLKPLYTNYIKSDDGYAAMSKASILRVLGIHWQMQSPEIFLQPSELAAAQTLLTSLGHQQQTLITLDPTHRQTTRRWPLTNYAKLLFLLAKNHDVQFLPLWGPGEEAEIKQLQALTLALGLEPQRFLMPDKMLSLREMAACIAQADFHLGNCSAPRHIAAAVGTKSLTILGSTSQAWTCPLQPPKHFAIALGLPCQPCNKNHCDHCRCLHDLMPEAVYQRLAYCLNLNK